MLHVDISKVKSQRMVKQVNRRKHNNIKYLSNQKESKEGG